jgi:hypothetical protein
VGWAEDRSHGLGCRSIHGLDCKASKQAHPSMGPRQPPRTVASTTQTHRKASTARRPFVEFFPAWAVSVKFFFCSSLGRRCLRKKLVPAGIC